VFKRDRSYYERDTRRTYHVDVFLTTSGDWRYAKRDDGWWRAVEDDRQSPAPAALDEWAAVGSAMRQLSRASGVVPVAEERRESLSPTPARAKVLRHLVAEGRLSQDEADRLAPGGAVSDAAWAIIRDRQ
jgi:hypothetical protein